MRPAAEAVIMMRPERCARALPSELSDSVRQRAIIAMATANDPRVLIVDELSPALDPATQGEILDLLTDLRKELGMALVLIGNRESVTAAADRVVPIHAGQSVQPH